MKSHVSQIAPLTSLRFFAALHVVLFHYAAMFEFGMTSPFRTFASLGCASVSFFFMMSGYILAHNYSNTNFHDRTQIIRFFVLRVARILPVYLLSLAFFAPFAFAIALNYRALPELSRMSALILTPLGLQAWVPGSACIWNCPSWSVSAEFFLYACFPALIVLASVAPRRFSLAAGTALLMSLGSAIYLWDRFGVGSIVHAEPNSSPFNTELQEFIKFFPLFRLPEFMLGIALYQLVSRLKRLPPAWLLYLSGIVTYGVFALLAPHVPEIFVSNGGFLLPFGLLIVAGVAAKGRGLLAHPVSVFLGKISFAMYLFHIPVLAVATAFSRRIAGPGLLAKPLAPLMLAITIGLSVCIYRYFEEPIRHSVAGFANRAALRRTA